MPTRDAVGRSVVLLGRLSTVPRAIRRHRRRRSHAQSALLSPAGASPHLRKPAARLGSPSGHCQAVALPRLGLAWRSKRVLRDRRAVITGPEKDIMGLILKPLHPVLAAEASGLD